MKRYSILKYILFAVILVTAGCYKDKGNYDYHNVNEITITGIEEYYSAVIGAPLTIKPELEQTIPVDEENLSYLWLKIGTSTTGRQFDTIWRKKYVDGDFLPLPVSKSKIVYKVTDNTTGITYVSEPFSIEILNDIQKGFLILTENEGKTDLRFLNYTGSTSANGYLDGKFDMRSVNLSELPELGRPYSIVCYNDYMNAPALGQRTDIGAVRFSTETGVYTLRRTDFHYEDLYHGSYFIFGDMTGLQVRKMIRPAAGGQWSCMLMDQDNNYMMYRQAGGAGGVQFWTIGSYTNSYQQSGQLEKVYRTLPPPAMAFNMNAGNEATVGVVTYDLDSKSFAYRYGTMTLYSSKYDVGAEEYFKFNNTDFTPRFIYYRPMNEDSDTPFAVYSIVKQDNTDEMYLLKWHCSTGKQYFKHRLYPASETDVVLPGILNTKLFAMSTTSVADQRPFIYYATDNKVYVYNCYDKGVTEVWTVPAGNTITHIEILNSMTGTGITVACPFRDNLVIVSDAADGTSTFQVCKIANTYGTLTYGEVGKEGSKQKTEWSGLPRIVSFDWKLL